MTTIVAPATPRGTSAVAIVRMSGPRAIEIAGKVTGQPTEGWRHRENHLATLYDQRGQVLDQALIAVFMGPHSYSGEDIVEFHTHGNPVIVASLMGCLIEFGAVVAEAGAFTRRAILNGKMGLPEAEALAELLEANSPVGAAQAIGRLKGELRRWASSVRQELIGIIAQLEAYIDFPEEPISPQAMTGLAERCQILQRDICRQAEQAHLSRIWTRGAKIAILGAPNTGKSTLLNTLAGQERAIVSPWAGTTRDYLEVGTHLEGLPIQLVDTAGLRETDDPIEKLGIDRGLGQANCADLVIWLHSGDTDVGTQLETSESAVAELNVWNKVDQQPAPKGYIPIAAKTGQGINTLIEKIIEHLPMPDQDTVVHGLRQERACVQAAAFIATAHQQLADECPPEMAVEELRLAARQLDSLLGVIDPEDVLDELFSTFCIGK